MQWSEEAVEAFRRTLDGEIEYMRDYSSPEARDKAIRNQPIKSDYYHGKSKGLNEGLASLYRVKAALAALQPFIEPEGKPEWADQTLIDELREIITQGRIHDATSNSIACIALNAVLRAARPAPPASGGEKT